MGTCDVLLVQPPFPGPYHFWKSECLGIGYLAAALESRGWRVETLDAFLLDVPIEECVDRILRSPPRLLLGFSMLSYEMFRSGETICRRLRQAGYSGHITAGSWFPTFWHETIFEEGLPVDSIVAGEGEEAVCKLVEALDRGALAGLRSRLHVTPAPGGLLLRSGTPPADLDKLSHPRRDGLAAALERYGLATCHGSRGCGYGGCSFCSVSGFYRGAKRHRQRSVENVVDEVRDLARRGADFVFFTDEDFVGWAPGGPARAARLFERLAEEAPGVRYVFNCRIPSVEPALFRHLADRGLAAAYVGVENCCDRILASLGKGFVADDVRRAVGVLKDCGVRLVPGWIMFERDTTLDEVEAQLAFLRELDCYHVNYLKSLYVMKDTAMERRYGDDLLRLHFHRHYYFRDPRVDLVVRILQSDYLPEAIPWTAGLYPAWHRLLAGRGTSEEQSAYDQINGRMKSLSLDFASEVVARVRAGSLEGLGRTIGEYAVAWREVGAEIGRLAGGKGRG